MSEKKPGRATAFAIPKPEEIQQKREERAEQEPETITELRSQEDDPYDPFTDQIFQGEVFTNLDKSKDKKIVDFNFKVTPNLRHSFKIVSANWNITNKALLEACYKLFLDHYGRSPQEAKRKHRERAKIGQKIGQEPSEN